MVILLKITMGLPAPQQIAAHPTVTAPTPVFEERTTGRFHQKKFTAMKCTLTFFLFSFCLLPGKIKACSCAPIPDFCQTVTFLNNGEIIDDINIYHVQVSAQSTSGMKVKILKTYHGEALNGQEIFIQSGNGADCQVITSIFQIGQQMILAVRRIGDFWSLSECGVTYLKVENGQVSGAIAPGIQELPLADFPSLANCGNLTNTEEPAGGFSLSVQPALARQLVSISTTSTSRADLKLSVFDPTGRRVFQAVEKGFSAAATLQVDVQGWSAGFYFFKVALAGQERVFKVVKM